MVTRSKRKAVGMQPTDSKALIVKKPKSIPVNTHFPISIHITKDASAVFTFNNEETLKKFRNYIKKYYQIYIKKGDIFGCQLRFNSNNFNRMLNHIDLLLIFNKLSDHEQFLFVRNLFMNYEKNLFRGIISALSVKAISKFLCYKKDQNGTIVEDISNLSQNDSDWLFKQLSYADFAKLLLALTTTCDVDNNFARVSLSYVFTSLNQIKDLSNTIPSLEKIEFYDRGKSEDNWSVINKNILDLVPKIKNYQHFPKLFENISKIEIPKLTCKIEDELSNKWKFLRLQGRTLLFENENNEMLAIKVAKQNEYESDLAKEYQMTHFLRKNQHKFSLKSNFPEPLFMTTWHTFSLSDWLKKHAGADACRTFFYMVSNFRWETYVYAYKTKQNKEDYFTYLHNPTMTGTQFKNANRNIVNDLYILLSKGIVFNQLADIFHNTESTQDTRKDRGRYIVLSNLLYSWNQGSGRLTGWKNAVKYPNVRASGIADLGDCIPLSRLFNYNLYVMQFYGFVRDKQKEKTGNYLMANVIAEYQYVLFLIAGLRAAQLTENKKLTKSQAYKIWYSMAEQVVDNCSQAVSILSNQNEQQVKLTLLAFVDLHRLARQMQYWMTTEYIDDIKNNKIRSGIYEEETRVTVSYQRLRKDTFNDKLGCSIDGINQDLGPVNGPEPIKEANKLFYWMVNIIFYKYIIFTEMLNDLKVLNKQKTFEEEEKCREKAFTIPLKQFYFMNHEVCKQLATRKGITKEQKIELEKNAEYYKRNYASTVISQFWRSKKFEKRIKEEDLKIQPLRPFF